MSPASSDGTLSPRNRRRPVSVARTSASELVATQAPAAMDNAPATATVTPAASTETELPKAAKKPLTAPRISTRPSFSPRKMLRTRAGLSRRSASPITTASSCSNSSSRMLRTAAPRGPFRYVVQTFRYFRTPYTSIASSTRWIAGAPKSRQTRTMRWSFSRRARSRCSTCRSKKSRQKARCRASIGISRSRIDRSSPLATSRRD